jgi:ADP-ribose pyrophosphatase YjhB (NUDIX family)
MVVVAPDNKILFLDRLKGIFGGPDSYRSEYDPGLGWACPAGHIENGESPFSAGLRELREETDISEYQHAKIVAELWASNSCRERSHHYWWIMLVKVDNHSAKLCEPEKHRQLAWFSYEEAMNQDLEPAWRAILVYLRSKGII